MCDFRAACATSIHCPSLIFDFSYRASVYFLCFCPMIVPPSTSNPPSIGSLELHKRPGKFFCLYSTIFILCTFLSYLSCCVLAMALLRPLFNLGSPAGGGGKGSRNPAALHQGKIITRSRLFRRQSELASRSRGSRRRLLRRAFVSRRPSLDLLRPFWPTLLRLLRTPTILLSPSVRQRNSVSSCLCCSFATKV